jgi:carboxypeptidase T
VVTDRQVVPWRELVVASLVLLATAWPHDPTGADPRVAIRVACDRPAACELARAIALDVWSEHHGPGLPLDVVVARGALATLEHAGITWQVLVADIDAVAAAEAVRLAEPAAAQPADWFGEFRDYRAIATYLQTLADQHPDRASLAAIGGSVEGRPLWALRVGTPGGTRMLIDGTLHAREWIAAMVATCIADRLVRDADAPAIRALLDRTELWIVPVVNPDGYQYSWSDDRYWRKNRRDRHGVDLNRNFSVAWGGSGSSRSERSETYRGAYAFSEPETAALRDLVKREGIELHIDLHAYGQLVLYPWSHTASHARDRDRFRAMGDRIASAMFAEHEKRYTLSSGAELYPASGTMTDWMYGEAEATSFTIELRPKGGSGFVLPPDQIRPTCDEGLAAVLALRAAHH